MLATFFMVTSTLLHVIAPSAPANANLLPNPSPAALQAPLSGKELKARFETLDSADKHDDVVKLFRDNPNGVMFLIDSYLEGSLGLFEKEGNAKAADIKAMHERALRGAKAASQAFMSPDIYDYTSSFVGWSDDQKKQFRVGQRECRASSNAFKEKKYDEAVTHAQAGLDAAWPLGDWWGTAMAMSALGRAHGGLGKHEEALKSISTARILYHGLALHRSANGLDLQMAPILMQLGRLPRATVTIERGLMNADRYNDARSKLKFLELRADLEELEGKSDAATKTRAEAEALKAKQQKKK